VLLSWSKHQILKKKMICIYTQDKKMYTICPGFFKAISSICQSFVVVVNESKQDLDITEPLWLRIWMKQRNQQNERVFAKNRTRLSEKDEWSLMFKEETYDIKKQGCVGIVFVNSVILTSEISVMPNCFIWTVLIKIK